MYILWCKIKIIRLQQSLASNCVNSTEFTVCRDLQNWFDLGKNQGNSYYVYTRAGCVCVCVVYVCVCACVCVCVCDTFVILIVIFRTQCMQRARLEIGFDSQISSKIRENYKCKVYDFNKNIQNNNCHVRKLIWAVIYLTYFMLLRNTHVSYAMYPW